MQERTGEPDVNASTETDVRPQEAAWMPDFSGEESLFDIDPPAEHPGDNPADHPADPPVAMVSEAAAAAPAAVPPSSPTGADDEAEERFRTFWNGPQGSPPGIGCDPAPGLWSGPVVAKVRPIQRFDDSEIHGLWDEAPITAGDIDAHHRAPSRVGDDLHRGSEIVPSLDTATSGAHPVTGGGRPMAVADSHDEPSVPDWKQKWGPDALEPPFPGTGLLHRSGPVPVAARIGSDGLAHHQPPIPPIDERGTTPDVTSDVTPEPASEHTPDIRPPSSDDPAADTPDDDPAPTDEREQINPLTIRRLLLAAAATAAVILLLLGGSRVLSGSNPGPSTTVSVNTSVVVTTPSSPPSLPPTTLAVVQFG